MSETKKSILVQNLILNISEGETLEEFSERVKASAEQELEQFTETLQKEKQEIINAIEDEMIKLEQSRESNLKQFEEEIRLSAAQDLKDQFAKFKQELTLQMEEKENEALSLEDIESKIRERLKCEMEQKLNEEMIRLEKVERISMERKIKKEIAIQEDFYRIERENKVGAMDKEIEALKNEISRLKSLENVRLKAFKVSVEKPEVKGKEKSKKERIAEIHYPIKPKRPKPPKTLKPKKEIQNELSIIQNHEEFNDEKETKEIPFENLMREKFPELFLVPEISGIDEMVEKEIERLVGMEDYEKELSRRKKCGKRVRTENSNYENDQLSPSFLDSTILKPKSQFALDYETFLTSNLKDKAKNAICNSEATMKKNHPSSLYRKFLEIGDVPVKRLNFNEKYERIFQIKDHDKPNDKIMKKLFNTIISYDQKLEKMILKFKGLKTRVISIYEENQNLDQELLERLLDLFSDCHLSFQKRNSHLERIINLSSEEIDNYVFETYMALFRKYEGNTEILNIMAKREKLRSKIDLEEFAFSVNRVIYEKLEQNAEEGISLLKSSNEALKLIEYEGFEVLKLLEFDKWEANYHKNEESRANLISKVKRIF